VDGIEWWGCGGTHGKAQRLAAFGRSAGRRR
jgi:hypothetical protein